MTMIDMPSIRRGWGGLIACAACVLAGFSIPAAAEAELPPVVGFGANHQWNAQDSTPITVEKEDVLAAAAGADVLRVTVGWNRLQPNGPGSFNQNQVDWLTEVMDLAADEGLKIDAIVTHTPCWASSTPFKVGDVCLGDYALYPPSWPVNLGRFVEWLTDNYAYALEAVEIWNEPNWGGAMLRGPNPAGAYNDMVFQAHSKATNGVPVWAGSLHWNGSPIDPSTSGAAWTDSLLGWGIDNHVDAWSVHTYHPQPQGVVDRIETYRSQFVDHDAEHVPFVVTEFGWRTFGGNNSVSEQQQADLLVEGFQAIGELDYVTHALHLSLRDRSAHNQYAEGYGILHEDFCDKPAYDALRDLFGQPPFTNPYCSP